MLFLACWGDLEEISRNLILSGADINAEDSRGWTPLIIAVHHDHENIVRLLLEFNADVLHTDIVTFT